MVRGTKVRQKRAPPILFMTIHTFKRISGRTKRTMPERDRARDKVDFMTNAGAVFGDVDKLVMVEWNIYENHSCNYGSRFSQAPRFYCNGCYA